MPPIVIAIACALLAALLLLAPDRHFRSEGRRLRQLGAGCFVLAGAVNVAVVLGVIQGQRITRACRRPVER